MFTVNVNIQRRNTAEYEKYLKRVKEISSKKVAAGFPHGKLNNPHYEPGKDGKPGPSIIDVAIWNNFGIKVPRRDFMSMANKKWEPYFENMAKEMGKALLTGKMDIDTFLNLMGQAGAEFISEAIVKLKTPPNSPATIKKKKSSNPLVDSGDLSKAATYEIRMKNK